VLADTAVRGHDLDEVKAIAAREAAIEAMQTELRIWIMQKHRLSCLKHLRKFKQLNGFVKQRTKCSKQDGVV